MPRTQVPVCFVFTIVVRDRDNHCWKHHVTLYRPVGNFIFLKKKESRTKNSNERGDYESVDDRSLSKVISRKPKGKEIGQ